MPLSWDEAVDALHAHGVRYLSGGSAASLSADHEPDPATLLASLAQSDEPRLRHAITALLLLHPDFADAAQQAASSLPPDPRSALLESYVAAVYLQRNWRTRLRHYLGEQPLLPALWIEDLGLPPPDARFGRLGLAALAARIAGSNRVRRSVYEDVADHVLAQLRAERSLRDYGHVQRGRSEFAVTR